MIADVTAIVVDTIRMLNPDKKINLDLQSAREITLGELDFDSLATLRLAMELEDVLGITIEVVDFPETLTVAALANRLEKFMNVNGLVPAST